MPRYDYECETCHHLFELKQSFDSDPVAACPECSGDSRRKFHSVPIVFKGSGWYVNDYGKKNNNASGSSEKSDEKESKSSSEKSESKSDNKTDSKKEPVASKSSSESTSSKTKDN